MNRVLSLTVVLVLTLACRLAARTNDISTKDLAQMQERLKKTMLVDINLIVSHIRDGTISHAESRKLEDLMYLATRDELRGKGVTERQQIVVSLLGKAAYKDVRSYYMNECQSASSSADRQLAVDVLGHRLFSIESRDVLMPLVLSTDRQTQFLAIISLACIDEKGAYSLLHYMVLSQRFGDIETSYAMDALGVANDPDAGHLAMQLCLSTNVGPMVVSTCLPLMKNEPKYFQIVCDMIKDNRFTPPKRQETMTGEELARGSVVMDLIRVVDDNVERLIKDDALFKKIREYAESNDVYYVVCDEALMILKKAGADRKYFERLLSGEGLPAEKQRALRAILGQIDRASSAGPGGGQG